MTEPTTEAALLALADKFDSPDELPGLVSSKDVGYELRELAAALRERPSDAALVAYAADALRILENAHYPSTGDEDSPDAFAVIEGLRAALAPSADELPGPSA